MAKFHMLDKVVFMYDFPAHKVKIGDHGQVNQASGDGKYWVQVGQDDDAELVMCTENEIAHPIGQREHYSKQPLYCNHCGKVFDTDFLQFDGRVCGIDCHKQVEWKRTLSIMGSVPGPMPDDI